jgi:hypothetical protein
MIRVTVTKNSQTTNKQDFSTQELADAWKESNIASGAFGKPERWLQADDFEDESAEDAIATTTVDVLGQEITLYKFAADYTITEEDVTSEYEAAALKAESVEAINLGADLIADIRTLNKKKLLDGSLTSEQFTALLQDATAAAIERALWNGSFQTAKTLIQGFSGYYSSGDKTPLIAKIDAFLTKYP